MGAGAVFLLFVVLVVVAIAVGVLLAIRAGLWARETGPKAEEPRDGRPAHLAVDDEAEARFDVSDRDRESTQARDGTGATDPSRR
jgi:hypothetical protein